MAGLEDAGIYAIVNRLNGKMLIASAINLEQAREEQLRLLRERRHPNKHLQAAYNKYGSEHFEFEVIERCPFSALRDREDHWCFMFRSKAGYNYKWVEMK